MERGNERPRRSEQAGFTGLQDGEYTVTASRTATHKVDGEPTQSVWVYHDEATGDAGTDKARWTTTRIGLKIMGYIGNDANSDRRMRGDEAPAGVTVRLTRGPETVATAETDERGLYIFENLEEGRYAVTPGSGSDYMVLRGFDANTGAAITTAIATADEYPALREGRYRLPSWDYANSSANNTSVKVQAQFSREYEVWRSPGTLGGDRRAPTLAVLQVYDTKLSASDSLGDLPGIKARMQGRYSSTYNDTLTWTPDWTREPDSEETRSATPRSAPSAGRRRASRSPSRGTGRYPRAPASWSGRTPRSAPTMRASWTSTGPAPPAPPRGKPP